MFVGHYGVSFAIQPSGRRVPLWVWFIAVQWLDARMRTTLLIAMASFSHWVLDLVVHTHDLPLYGDSAKVGFGLWQALSFPLELATLGLGAWLYARAKRYATAKGQYALCGFVAVLAAIQVYANFGPPPSSPNAMAITALGLYAALALSAAQVERSAV